MKILQISKLYYPWIGGVEKVVQEIAEGLKKEFVMEVLCCNNSRQSKKETINGVKVHRSGSFGILWGMPLSFRFLFDFRKLRNKFNILFFHQPFPLADLALFLFRSKTKVIVFYHSDIVRQRITRFITKPLLINTLKKAEKIFVSNPNIIKNSPILRKFQNKCVIVPFGVDIDEINKLKDNQKIEAIRKKYRKFVLFVGRLSYYKGVEYLIRAMKDIDANLIIIGEGNQKKYLASVVKELKLENKVFFLSHQNRESLVNFYWACEVFVLPSIFKSEAFGLVLLEAMACGKPVISTELGTGTSWVNEHGKTGFVVPHKNSEQLKEAIEMILTNSSLQKEMGEKAKKRAIEKFTKKRFIQRIKEELLLLKK